MAADVDVTVVDGLGGAARNQFAALAGGGLSVRSDAGVVVPERGASGTRGLRRFYSSDLEHRLDGTAVVHVVERDGVAFWHPPDQWQLRTRSAVGIAPTMASVLWHHPVGAVRVLRAVLRHHPVEPHWYLSHLAVAPSERGRGIGRALVEAGLRRALAENVGAYLETANPENLAFYQRIGFSQIGLTRVTGAPPVWMLWWAPLDARHGSGLRARPEPADVNVRSRGRSPSSRPPNGRSRGTR